MTTTGTEDPMLAAAEPTASQIVSIPLDASDVDGNPRSKPGELEELADSIRAQGVITPIMVRAVGDRFRVVFGQRRTLASRIAGRTTIPAIVTDDDPRLDLAKAIVENIQRSDLNAIDEARAMERMVAAGATHAEVGRLLGRSPSHVSNRLRLLRGDPYLVEAVEQGLLPTMSAIVIVGLPLRQQRAVAKRAVIEQWSQHRLERELGPRDNGKAKRGPTREIGQPTDVAPSDASRYAPGFAKLASKADDTLVRFLVWAIVEMDVFIQGRFEKRHPTGRKGEDRIWQAVNDLPPAAARAELAQVLAEMVAEYGPTGVRAAVPRG